MKARGKGPGKTYGSTPDHVGGKGRNKGGALGPGGFCICTKCGERVAHRKGVKCTTLKCPKCNHVMIREDLLKKDKSKI